MLRRQRKGKQGPNDRTFVGGDGADRERFLAGGLGVQMHFGESVASGRTGFRRDRYVSTTAAGTGQPGRTWWKKNWN